MLDPDERERLRADIHRNFMTVPLWRLYELAAQEHARAGDPDPMGEHLRGVHDRVAWMAQRNADERAMDQPGV